MNEMKRRNAVVITSSDTGYEKKREDKSGPLVKEILEQAGYHVIRVVVLPDERQMLADEMRRIADYGEAELIMTTGGTGFSERDCTPEATLDVITRQVPGIPEAMRMFSMQITKRAMLTRGTAGIRGKTLIINLPGSPKAVKECLEIILPEIAHGLDILTGDAGDCAKDRERSGQ